MNLVVLALKFRVVAQSKLDTTVVLEKRAFQERHMIKRWGN